MQSAMTPARRVAALRPTAVNAITAEVRELKRQGHATVSLMRGEPDLATPAHIVAAAVESLHAGRTSYPNNRGEPKLCEAVAAKLARQTGVSYSPTDEILITTGATFGIHAALTAMLDPGDEVLVPQPIYDAYQSAIVLAGAISHAVPARIVDDRFTLDPDTLAAACGPRTRALLLNSPWNPTGTVFRRAEIEQLLEFARERDLVVISDEIYEEIVYDGRTHVSPVTLSDDAASRTIIVNSFSKTYAMTGWRLGYCAAPAEIAAAMFLVLQQSSRGPSTFVQDAGTAALSGPQDCVTGMREEYQQRRDQVVAALEDLPGVRVLVPEGGFFVMLDVHELGEDSNEIRRRLLHEHGVVVVHGAAYGKSAEGTLRVSFASGGANLQEGLERLRGGLESIRRG